MNNAKRTLIKISGILAIIEAVGLFLSSIMFILGSSFMIELLKSLQEGATESGWDVSGTAAPTDIGVGIIIAIGIILLLFAVFALTGGILLLQSVSVPEKFTAKRKRFITGSVFTIIATGVVSIAAILLYVAFALKDEAPAQTAPAAQTVVDVKPESSNQAPIKGQMEALREMRDKGEITEEEFKQMMLDLIKKG